jgi:hypothetical protein
MSKVAANDPAKNLSRDASSVQFYRNATLDLADEVARNSGTSAEKLEELWASMHEDVRRLAEALVARKLK